MKIDVKRKGKIVIIYLKKNEFINSNRDNRKKY